MLAFFSALGLMANFSILLARLRSKTKFSQVLLREVLFADEAALVAHSDDDFQNDKNLLKGFSNACDNFGLTVSLRKKNKIMPRGTDVSLSLEMVNSFTYRLGSTFTSTSSLDAEIEKRILGTLPPTCPSWENQKLMQLSMSSRRGGRRGIGRDFDIFQKTDRQTFFIWGLIQRKYIDYNSK